MTFALPSAGNAIAACRCTACRAAAAGTVFAFRHEVDAWLRSREREEERGAASPPPPTAALSPAPSAPTEPQTGGARRGGVGRARIAAVATGLLVVAAGAAALRGGRQWPGTRPAPTARLGTLGYSPRELVARADDGSVLWRYAPPQPIETAILEAGTPPWYALADFDDDGRQDVVATVPLKLEGPQTPGQHLAADELYCFSAEGRVLWKTRLEDHVTFRAGSFGPPWVAGRVVVYRTRDGLRIAWSQAHHTWWPSLLVTLDARGTRLSTFVHAGSIRALHAVESGGRSLLFAGGVANPFRAAFLAVLDGGAVQGHGPVAAGSPYECLGCADGLPLRYFLFPPSDINRASGLPYNSLARILSFGRALEAFTVESNGNTTALAEMSFRFSPEVELVDARSSDSWAAHESLERAGKIDHSVTQCPWYRKPPPVREWRPTGGWHDIVPGTAMQTASGVEPTPALPPR